MRNAGKGSLKRFSGVLCAAGLAAALVGAPATAFADDAASDLTVADSVVSEEVVEASAVIENSAQDSELSQVPTVPALPGGDSDDGESDEVSPPATPAEPVVPGLKPNGDRFQYVGPDGLLVKSSWEKVNGKWYYFDEDGESVRWSQRIGGKWYYFDRDCSMHRGWLRWAADSSWSYFGSGGAQLTGWQKIGGKWYYLNPSDGKAVTGSQRIGGKWYYFDRDCSMHRGWLRWAADSSWSYFGSGGAQLTGWQKIGGKWYYLNPSDGKAVTGSQRIGGKWYYFNGASQMHTGWLKWNGKQLWSYYWDDGSRADGAQTIAGYKYVFDANGQTATAPVTRPADEYAMERKAQSYSSSTSYMILVNRSTHKLGVFERKAGRWEMTAYWDCVTGKPSTPTITGSFKTTGGKRSSLSTDSRAKYCTQITGGYFFHTILSSNNELGKSLSHGCIRLSYSSAKWIYQHIHAGTRVVIY